VARLRVGVALLLPSPVAEEVEGLRRASGDRSLGRVPPHVTLVPPVNIRHEDLGRALAVLRAAAAATARDVAVSLEAPTSFLPDNPVLYLPVGGDVAAIHELRRRIWEPPLTRALTWPFVPHVTLADQAPRERIDAARMALAGYRNTVAFDRIHLLVERRGGLPGRPGPRWQPLADAAFGPPAVVARAGPLALELVRSHQVDPEGAALLKAEGADLGVPPAPIRGPEVVTARREGDVVGVAAGWLTGEGPTSTIFVAPVHRRQGIGRHLQGALAVAIDDAGWDGDSTPGSRPPKGG
jgi:2'-5' RNA ligase/GNAT superfamily N-acetyltransferase